MQTETVQKLLDINHQFYQKFGDAFAATRRRIQPGIYHLLATLPKHGHWLDLGCGSGALSQVWIEQGRTGSYTGLDFSRPLLKEARRGLAEQTLPEDLSVNFFEADLLDDHWVAAAPREQYDGVLCFAAMHHIPGHDNHLKLVSAARALLPAGGLFIHSNWQVQNSPKLMARVQPWSLVGIQDQDVEAGDTLLDWRFALPGQADQIGYRYVHLFTEDELSELAAASDFAVLDSFYSDGSGGRLGLYQIWQAR
jgi:SAM-dependent methyltransferase